MNSIVNKVLKHLWGGVKLIDKGKGNSIKIDSKIKGIGYLKIIINGNFNTIVIGSNCLLYRNNVIFIQGDGNSVTIGSNVSFDQDVSLVCCEGTSIQIGDDCMFAKGVRVRTSDQHPIYDANGVRINHPDNVKIGNHVWIGVTSIIMKGVKIGNGSVIGANSMVTKNLPENVVAVGQPCRVIKNNIQWERYF